MKDPFEIEQFISEHSCFIDRIFGVQFLAKGGEALIMRVEHGGLDELVVKNPLFESEASSFD